MTPVGHTLVGLCIAGGAARCGWHINRAGVVLGSVLPDLDILVFVPFLGRMQGHRTITHAPVVQIGLAWLLARFDSGSVLLGMLAHSGVDSVGDGNPRGVAWLWPVVRRRWPNPWRIRTI